MVQAVSSGTALVQATHEGASALFSVEVMLGGADSDGDGIPDDVEIGLGLNTRNPVDASEDADRDGLTNKDEYQLLGTDVRKADTDGDGLSDGVEIFGSEWIQNRSLEDRIPMETGSMTVSRSRPAATRSAQAASISRRR